MSATLEQICEQAESLASHADKLAEWTGWGSLAEADLDRQVLQARANLILEQAQTLAEWCKNDSQ